MSVIDEVKDRLDIVEVISSYTPLQKAGRNFKALCPFHTEKTPSFVVFPESQNWHCFGACGEGGDVFSFVMKWEGWDFRTALEELARRAGVELRPRTPAQKEAEEKADRLRGLLDVCAQYYHHLLLHAPEAEKARAYVAERGLDEESVERFTLGYSLPGWDSARAYLTERDYTVEELVEAGVLVRREDTQRTYDRFRDRLMIPIRDRDGRVIGFGARTLDPDGIPKYLNSPKTALFDKSHTLYGLDLARKTIRREDRAVIVEGYMDVIQAHQAGFTNVVAQMGTALTEAQLKQLQRYTERLVLSLDPDAAGVQATLRGVEVARETLEQEWEPVFDPRGLVGRESRLGAEIRILQLPPGQDPDDLIRETPERWESLIQAALPVVDFYLQILIQGLDVDDTKAKAQVVDELLPVLRAVANPVERSDYVQKIARALQLEVRAVQSRLDSIARPGAQRPTPRPPSEAPAGPGAPSRAEADLEGHCLALCLQRSSILAQVNETLQEGEQEPLQIRDFQDTNYRVFFITWQTLIEEQQHIPIDALYERLPTELHQSLAQLLSEEQIEPTLADEQVARDIIVTLLRLRERHLKRLGRELGVLTREAQEGGDVRAEQYGIAWRAHAEMLRRTQQALDQQWH